MYAYRNGNYLHNHDASIIINHDETTWKFKIQQNNHMTQNKTKVAYSARLCLALLWLEIIQLCRLYRWLLCKNKSGNNQTKIIKTCSQFHLTYSQSKRCSYWKRFILETSFIFISYSEASVFIFCYICYPW